MIDTYFLQRNVSEKFSKPKPLKEMARTLLSEKNIVGGSASSEREYVDLRANK